MDRVKAAHQHRLVTAQGRDLLIGRGRIEVREVDARTEGRHGLREDRRIHPAEGLPAGEPRGGHGGDAGRLLRVRGVDDARQATVAGILPDTDGVRARRRAAVGELPPQGKVRERLRRRRRPASIAFTRADGEQLLVEEHLSFGRQREANRPVRHALAHRRIGGAREEDVRPGLRRCVVRRHAKAAAFVLLEVEVSEERVRVDEARAMVRTNLEGRLGDHRELEDARAISPSQRPDGKGSERGDFERHGRGRLAKIGEVICSGPSMGTSAKKLGREEAPSRAQIRTPSGASAETEGERLVLRDARGAIVVVYDAERGTAEIAAPAGDLVLSAPQGKSRSARARSSARPAGSSSARNGSSSRRETSTAKSRGCSRRGPNGCARWPGARTSSSRSASTSPPKRTRPWMESASFSAESHFEGFDGVLPERDPAVAVGDEAHAAVLRDDDHYRLR